MTSITGATASTRPLPPAKARLWSGTTLIALALWLVTFAAFAPAIGHDFVSYDDLGFVTKNDWVKHGLTWSNVAHALRTTEMANWHPLTWLSYLSDVSLFGLAPWGFHLTNCLLHALNCALVFLVFRALTGATGRSVALAFFFALHPMHVESVAWVAERKDVLCTAFWLVTTWLYVAWVRRRAAGARRAWVFYSAVVVVYGLGLMAKPMLVTLPCVLLLLDYWPLQRWPLDGVRRWPRLGWLVLEKVPLVLLAALDSLVTVKAQASIGAVIELARVPWHARVENALVSYVSYLAKCFFPNRLAVYYPYETHSVVSAALCGVVLGGLLVGAWLVRRRLPAVFIGCAWFFGTLVPVIGLVQVGGQAMADRYSYVPYLGIFIAVIWGVAPVFAGGRAIARTAVALVLIAATVMTERQLSYWRNSGTLWGHTVAVTRDNVPAHLGLGYYYSELPGQLPAAIAEYREAARLAPNHADPHRSLAALLARSPATLREAIVEYRTTIRLDPNYVPAYLALGAAAEQVPGDDTDAIAAYEGALRIDPRNADAHNRLGNLLAADPARRGEAIEHFRAALANDPARVEIRLNLGAALADEGRLADAIAEYRKLVRAKPDFAEGHNNLANALVRAAAGAAEAETEYRAAIRLNPDYVEARFNYAQLLARVLGRPTDALAQLDEILRLRPDFEPAKRFADELRR